jgi:dolichyl-phosphate-mannose-protein mannosyltransferase
VVEDKLGQDAVAPPEDDHTTAVPIGVAEPRHDVYTKCEQKEIKSQMLAFDVPDVVLAESLVFRSRRREGD